MISGYRRMLLQDLQFNKVLLAPIELYMLICKPFAFEALNEIIETNIELGDWINYLEENDFIFSTNKPEAFPKLSLKYKYPSKITNAIVEINLNSNIVEENLQIFNELDAFNCKSILLIIFEFARNDFEQLLFDIRSTSIAQIEIIIADSSNATLDYFEEILYKNPRIKKVELFNSKEKPIASLNEHNSLLINHIKDYSNFSCGFISPKHFINNSPFLTESTSFNTCLNRKICIDLDGEIKNCPSMQKSFGNIKDTTLEEALNKPGFKDLWGIRKDDIDVCKDCEFRYMCTDCRAFIKSPNDIYSQPAKCTYNPYIALWEGQDGYISVEEWRRQNSDWEKGLKRYPLVKNPQKVE